MGVKPKYYSDSEALKHDDYCYVYVIAPSLRTMHSCNCSRKQEYQKNFKYTLKN